MEYLIMANLLSGQVFPFDPTGKLASNKITNEFHVITAANWRSYHFIVPKKAPYFEDSLVLTYRNASGVVVNLQKGVDWVPSYWYVGASRACAKNIYGGVTFLNAKLAGNIEISYQTIGGEWVLDDTAISEILANRLNNPINTTWEVIANVPKVFPPVPHEWDLIDMVGEEEVVEAIYSVRDALITKAGASNDGGNHLTDFNNPHRVTKAQVGLGNVNNFGAMSLTDTGSNSNELYTTPASVRILIENAIGSAFNTFKGRTDNPHNVTAEQVGTYSKSEIDAKLSTKLSETAIAFDSARFNGKSYQELKADILSGTAGNAMTLNGRTLDQIIESIQTAVTNGSTFGGYTVDELKTWILSGEISNSTKFNGRTEDQFAEWLNTNRKINAHLLSGKTYAELKTDVLSGTANNASLFNNMTPEAFAGYIKRINGTDAETLSGNTLQNIIDEARRGTVANANKAYGLTLEQLREQIQGTSDNSTKLAGKTYDQVKADILTGTAANANTVGGRTVDEIITLASSRGGDGSETAYGRTLEQLKSFILAGKSGDSTRLDGKSYTEVKEDIRNYVKQDNIARLIISGANGTTANRRRNYHVATIKPAYINNSANSQTGVIHVFGALSDNAFKALDNNTTAAEGNTSHLEMMILLNGKKLAAGDYTTCLTVEASVYNKAALPSGTTDERILNAVKNSYKFYFKADTATSTVKLYMTCEDRHQDITVMNLASNNEFIELTSNTVEGFSNTAENAAGMIAASYLPVIGKLDPAADTVNETTVNGKVAAVKSELTTAIDTKASAERTQSNNLYAPKTALTALQTADNNMLAMITRGNIGDVIIASNSANNIIDFNQSMCHEVTLPTSGTAKIDFRAKPLGANFTFTANQSGVTEYGLLTVVTGATLPVVQWKNNNTDTGILFSSGQAPVLAKNKTYVFNIIGMVDKTAPDAFKRVIVNLLCSY